MKKIVLLLIISIFLSGCTNMYELNINKDGIYEKIDIELDGNIYADDYSDFESSLSVIDLKNNIQLLNDGSKYYEKKVDTNNSKTNILLNGKYNYDEFNNSYLINRCFENVYINNTEDYLDINLSGFSCLYNEDIYIAVSSMYDVIQENSLKYEDGYYLWNLKTDDNISFTISKKELKKDSGKLTKVLTVVLLMSFALSGSLLFFIKKNNY